MVITRVLGLEDDWVKQDGRFMLRHVEPGMAWLEGDNKSGSTGKSSILGQVPLGLLVGRVVAVVWPPWRIGRVERHRSFVSRRVETDNRM